MNINNKVSLYKTTLLPIFLHAAPVWGSAANTNIQKIQILQNYFVRSNGKFPRYILNQTIHNTFKVESIRKIIKNLSENFFNPTIPNP